MKRWPARKLGEVARIRRGASPRPKGDPRYFGGDIPWLKIGDVPPGSRFVSQTEEGVTPAGRDLSVYVEPGTLLLSNSASVGRPVITKVGACIHDGWLAIDGYESKLRQDFLYWCLIWSHSQFQQLAPSGTQKNLNIGLLTGFEVAVPPLAEQGRIVKLLDEADELRKLRTQADHRTAALISSLFYERFGDLAANPKGWPEVQLGKVAIRVNVGYVGPTSKWYREEGIPFLRTQNVGNLLIRCDEIKHIAPEFHERIKKSQLRTGDVIISRVISDEINCAIVSSEFDGANCANIVVVSPGAQLDAHFLAVLILTAGAQNQLVGVSVGSAQTVVNTGSFRKWVIPVPPLVLQKEFAARVLEIRAMQTEQFASRRRLDDLFKSMLHRAFNGEL